jgi:hypothetical protein
MAVRAGPAWNEPTYSLYIPFFQYPQVPMPNSLYLGTGYCTDVEADAIFVTNQQLQIYYDEDSEEKSSPYIGLLVA